jgi:hypothetical protein
MNDKPLVSHKRMPAVFIYTTLQNLHTIHKDDLVFTHIRKGILS